MARLRWPAWTATLVVTGVVLGPLFVGGGFALRGDMVFTPDQPWKRAWLGLDGSVPRAVPLDAVVSLADEVLPGAWLQRLVLVAAFVLGGLGIARLAASLDGPLAGPLVGRLGTRTGATAQVAAVLVYLWNPWVHERLAIGQWPAVLGYGLLPWLVLSAARVREGERGGWSGTVLLLLLSGACAPSVGLVAVLVAVAVVATGPSRLRLVGVLGGALLANLPWIAPALVGPGLRGSDAQFGAFAARGESSLGTLASLLSMGGIWKASVVPPERGHVLVVAGAGLLAVVFLAGFRYAAGPLGRRTATGIAAAGGASLLVALLPAIGPIGDGLGSLSADVPALGILRDSQRYLAPLGLVLALGAAALVDRLVAGARAGRHAQGVTAALLVVAPVLLLPSMVWGLAGDLRPVTYPADWSRVATLVGRHTGATVVLPWTGSYRGYGWNDHRAVLDPAPRFLPGDVLIDDRVFLRDRTLPGEDPFLARVATALDGPDPAAGLRSLGVRWVLVENGNGVAPVDVPTGTQAYDGRWLRLIDLGGPERSLADVRDAPPAWFVLVCDGLALCVGCITMTTQLALLWAYRRIPV